MPDITVITGANKGLGRETARRLLELGHSVIVTARDVTRGRVAARELGADFAQLDVTDQSSVDAAAKGIAERYGRVDVLINNAGINGSNAALIDADAEAVLRVFDTNVLGAMRVTNAFLSLLRQSGHPRIVNVSSGTGSFAYSEANQWWTSPDVPQIYGTSKTALTKLTLCYAHSLPDMRVNAADPGWTATDLNGFQGRQDLQEGTDIIVKLASAPKTSATGTYVNRHGPVPW
jgi:NAD(P)-dependent dehydrogenase (short-subunit alcohol dehydrogenase family)